MSELLKHAIPGYGLYAMREAIHSDEPFAIKVRDVSLASTSLGMHYIFTTHHASKMMAHRIGAHSYSSHRTHGWSTTRTLIKSAPVVLPAIFTVAAQTNLAEKKGFVPSGSSMFGSFSFGSVLGF